jgi:negative regulator of replication initiation
VSYSVVIAADFGAANTGLTVYGKLFDTDGVQVGSTITTGFVEAVAGLYVYVLSCPSGQEGVLVVYDSANAALRRVAVVAPRETENSDVKSSTLATPTNVSDAQTAITDAIAALNNLSGSDVLALSVETGHSLQTVLRALYALNRGKSVADDADNPTEIVYYAPDNSTVRVTHTLTDTERTVA